jgi:hypothetical protein
MFWSLEMDDFRGEYCDQGNYPLLRAAKSSAMGTGSVASSTPSQGSGGNHGDGGREHTTPRDGVIVVHVVDSGPRTQSGLLTLALCFLISMLYWL